MKRFPLFYLLIPFSSLFQYSQQACHYNGFFKENFNAQSSDVEGCLAAGGNIDINYYSVSDKLDADEAGDILVTGGYITSLVGGLIFVISVLVRK